jgi:Uma2 family endonuclease
VRDFLARESAFDRDPRLKILEAADVQERCVRVRAKFAGPDADAARRDKITARQEFTFGGGRHDPVEFKEMATEVLEQATEERLIRRRASIEEFWSLPESVLPTEYIDGEIIMAPAPTVLHQLVQGNIYSALRTFVQGKGLGWIFGPPLDVVMPTGEVVQPDVFFLNTRQTERVRRAKRVEEVPPFLVEILSPGSVTHDTVRKREVYEKNGVREYWIVDVEGRTIAQLLLRRKHYVLTELGESDVIKASVLAGFEMTVGELLGV